MLFGAPLRIPGERLEDAEQPTGTETFIMAQRRRLRSLRLQPTSHHTRRAPFIHKELKEATHVFVKEDNARKTFQPPYTGPHEVVSRLNERLYTIRINGRDVNTSTDRLKPAYLSTENEEPPEEQRPENDQTEATGIRKATKNIFIHIPDIHSGGNRCGD